MKKNDAVFGFIFLCWAGLLTSQAIASIAVETVFIGNEGNPSDTAIMQDETTGYGSVAYGYFMAKHEVTNSQYAAFLNAVAADRDFPDSLRPTTTVGLSEDSIANREIRKHVLCSVERAPAAARP